MKSKKCINCNNQFHKPYGYGKLQWNERKYCSIKCSNINLRLKHGMEGTRIYKQWQGIKKRCLNINDKLYPHYGGRGITMFDEWIHSFSKFYEYIGNPPTTKHEIDRIDNNGNYEPGNIRWATRLEQMQNTRKTRYIEYNNEKFTIRTLCNKFNLEYNLVKDRVYSGWSIEKIIKIGNTRLINQYDAKSREQE